MISHLDHLVLSVSDIKRSCDFYQRVLRMEVVTFGENRKALCFGKQKINLHSVSHPIQPHALSVTRGSADLCLISELSIPLVCKHLEKESVKIELGPVERTGACGPIQSVYFRDPDGNLLEVGHYAKR